MKPEDSPNDGNELKTSVRIEGNHPTKDQTDSTIRPDHPAIRLNPHGELDGNRSQAEKERSCVKEHSLFEQVLERENLQRAWKQVKANKGAPDIDGMTIEEFSQFIRKHWETIQTKLRDGNYRPSPVKRIYIPKPDKPYEKRPLGIPTILDRVIQQAIAQILSPLYEPNSSDSSHGFRPCRSAHGAIKQWQKQSQKRRRRCYVVDCDLKSFFDTVDHQKLMNRLRQRTDDKALLRLIGYYLKAGLILPNGSYEETCIGMPQGGPLCPLLANILLDELDKELEVRGHQHVRYADDFLILCGSPRAGDRILRSISRYLNRHMKLMVNETKSKVVELSEASFLGFSIIKRKVRWTGQSKRRFKKSVRMITKRTRGVSPVKVIRDLQLYTRGAINYYMPGLHFQEARDLDQWLRRRVRLYYWKQWGRPRTRRRNLLKLGICRSEVHKASRSRKGPWRLTNTSIVIRAMTNQWLSDQGVPAGEGSIEQQWINIRYPDGPKQKVKAGRKVQGDLKV
ncbi:MAG: group II intron reverse transcriptase/maturase [Verrucomicrobiales bacterium]|nr:group II intron reverse transcriptase/maturase [Verrucomicrobiales bacterium]